MREAMFDKEDLSSGSRYDRGGNVVLRSGENPIEYDELGLEIDRLKEPSKRDSVAPARSLPMHLDSCVLLSNSSQASVVHFPVYSVEAVTV